MEAAREKQVDMLKTLMSDILRSVCTLLKQQLAGWVAVFIPARLWQSPGERRRDSLPPHICPRRRPTVGCDSHGGSPATTHCSPEGSNAHLGTLRCLCCAEASLELV